MKNLEIIKVEVKNVLTLGQHVIRASVLTIGFVLYSTNMNAQKRVIIVSNENNLGQLETIDYFLKLKPLRKKLTICNGITIKAGKKRTYFITLLFHQPKNIINISDFLVSEGDTIQQLDVFLQEIRNVGANEAQHLLSRVLFAREYKEGFFKPLSVTRIVYKTICKNDTSQITSSQPLLFNFCDHRVISNKNFFKEIPLEDYAEKTMGFIFQKETSKYFSIFDITSENFQSYSLNLSKYYYTPFISNMDERFIVNDKIGIIGFYGTYGVNNDEVKFFPELINGEPWKTFLRKIKI
jgi:hypothetical protein